MRASDADRERVTVVLREHYGDGRLTDDELAARIDRAMTAQTTQELELLTRDLPAPQHAAAPLPAERRAPLPAGFRIHLNVYLVVNAGLIAIWAASGGGYFWPIWPIIGWGMGVGACYAPIAARRGREQRGIVAPAEQRAIERASTPDGTVTILFSDICDSTALNERLGDVRWLELLRAHHAIVREQIAAHGGFEVKVQGDGFMIAFPSARKAVGCALAIRSEMQARLGDVRLRIGLHTGEAIREEDDFYGTSVVMASRIAQQAGPDEILVSTVVKQLLESAGDIRFEDGREVELKGLGTNRVHAVTG